MKATFQQVFLIQTTPYTKMQLRVIQANLVGYLTKIVAVPALSTMVDVLHEKVKRAHNAVHSLKNSDTMQFARYDL